MILTRRSDGLKRHSGQIALPGGRSDPGEAPWGTALREAEEEIGLDRSFVRLAGMGDSLRHGDRFPHPAGGRLRQPRLHKLQPDPARWPRCSRRRSAS